MIPEGEPLPPGYCQHCRAECADRYGSEIYPDRPELAEKIIWVCMYCGALVGTHEDGKDKGKPLGTAANAELRKARQFVHGLLDPLWLDAHKEPEYASARKEGDEAERRKALAIIKRTARKRVYEWLADQMELEFDRTHVALFDIDQCRRAYRALRGVTYAQVRAWARARPQADRPPSGKARRASGSAKSGHSHGS